MAFFLKKSAHVFVLSLLLAACAWSQCNNPSSPGVVICTPTVGSTVVYMPEVSAAATPSPGASISAMYMYDNGTLITKSGAGQNALNVYNGSTYNGEHHVVIKATDTDGNVYLATTDFLVTGQGYGPCPIPNSPGIDICTPPAHAIYGLSVAVDASAKGQSAITSLNFYLNGKLIASNPNTDSVGIAVQLAQQGVSNQLTVTATDANGNTYTAGKTLEADYTYSQYSCFYTCTPGINVVAPQDEAYVGNTFNLDMQITDNPNPITSMTAYIDKTEVASSSNANLQQQVTDAPNGTHILTINGVDSQGIKYFYQENININVSE
jgi:hypothetical protein